MGAGTAFAMAALLAACSSGNAPTAGPVVPPPPPPPPPLNAPPIAKAGADFAADALASVTLDGRASEDPEDQPLRFAWTQVAGPPVEITGADSAQPRFAAPDVDAATPLRFRLDVTDAGDAQASDEVVVTVAPVVADLARYVNPLVGSYPPGFVNPGPFAPFGMVQPGPDTEGPLNYGGYSVTNEVIHGFSHVHMSAGVPKGGQIPLMPLVGSIDTADPHSIGWPNPAPMYGSPFERATEVASAEYYRVLLTRYGVSAELVTTERASLHRYAYALSGTPRLLVHVSKDLTGYRPAQAVLGADGVLSGFVDTQGYKVFFAARFSAPFTAQTLDGTPLDADVPVAGEDLGVVLDFAELDAPLLVKLGLSHVDEAGALANLDQEIPDWDFDALRARSRAQWERELARILVAGGTDGERTSFYTALSRVQQFPNLLSDVDGRYPGPDGAIHTDAARPHYTQFSLWDSYRGQNQLLAEIQPARYRDMIASLLDFARQNKADPADAFGVLPRWQQAGKDASHMSGDPVIPFIGEGWCRGLVPMDSRAELLATMQHLEASRRERIALGYIPVPPPAHPVEEIEGGPGSTGTTLEYGLADFSLALMAASAGDALEAGRLAAQSLNYRNLLDPETGWIRPRHEDGSWLTPFAPELGYGFQEGTSWQYSWLAMHDLQGLFERMGGNATVGQRLDSFFGFPVALAPAAWPALQNQATVFGIAYYGNQYAPGNEHDLQAPYLYNYAGAPWKTQATARAASSIYTPTFNGLPGNDDLGALSGWLVWTMAGIYPMNPGTPLFVAGSPQFERVTLRRPGAPLVIEAPGANATNRFIQTAQFDAQSLDASWLVLPRAATTLRFEMGPLPNTAWGADPELAPPSLGNATLASFGCAP